MLRCLAGPEARRFSPVLRACSAFGIRPRSHSRQRRRTAHEDKLRNERNEEPWRKETRRQDDAAAAHGNGRRTPELQSRPQQAGRRRKGETPLDRRSARGEGRAGAGGSAQARRRTESGRPCASPAPAAEAPKPSGVVLRTLTDEERNARAHALADSRLREAEERKIAEEEALRRKSREVVDKTERDAADAAQARGRRPPQARRRSQAQGRRSRQETLRRGRSQAHRARGQAHARSRRGRSPPRAPRWCRPSGGCSAPGAPRRRRKAARPPHTGHGATRRRSARTLRCIVPAPHPAPQGSDLERAEGKAGARGHDPRGDLDSGSCQPHDRARGGRHPPADEARPDGDHQRRDRRRYRSADRRGNGPHGAPRVGSRRRGRPVRYRRRRGQA